MNPTGKNIASDKSWKGRKSPWLGTKNIWKLFYKVDLLFKEINIIKPKIIITFGNQVSSIILNKKISVSENRKKCYRIQINKNEYKVYPVYYPVGNGIFNIDKSIEDIKNKKIDVILIKDLSRLGRNYIETGNFVEVVFPAMEVFVISVEEN